ncbi:MAG: TIGR04053 family radical SAM/SPASM domain-containing protein [Acidimicrobiales bacterium]
MTPHLVVNDAGSTEVRGPTRSFDDRPLLVFWETTKACLLACRHCRANSQRDPGSDELSTAEGLALIDDLATIGRPRPIMILTGGDCLMRKDIVALTAHAKQMDVPVAIAPSTTPKLTPTILCQLRAQNVKTASLSLDGATPEIHEAVRGVNGHFDATMHAINNLKVHGYAVQVNTTVMRRNVGELADIASLMQRSGVNAWEVFFLITTGRGTRVEATSARENEDICHFLVDASRYGFTVRTVEAPFFRRVVVDRRRIGDGPPEHELELGPLYSHLRDRLHAQLGTPTAPVRAPSAATRDGKGVIFVANNGDVFPSGFLPLRLGSVREQSIAEIYRDHPLLHSIRDASFGGRCGTCEYADLCGGSRARAFAATGDPLGEDPGCIRAFAHVGQ